MKVQLSIYYIDYLCGFILKSNYLQTQVMKLTTPLTIHNNLLNDVWRMHDFNYQLSKDNFNEYWDEECILHITNSHFKIFDD